MTVYETPVRVQVNPTPGDPTRVRLTLSAHDGEVGMFEDVPVAWLRDQLGASVPGPAGDVDLDAIRARYEAATDGPWDCSEPEIDGVLVGRRTVVRARTEQGTMRRVVSVGQTRPHHREQAEENVEFIAHARTDVPALVAEVERLRAELDRQMPAALEAGEAIVDRAVNEAVAETEARMIARAEAAEAERDAAVARADTLAAQVDRMRAETLTELADEMDGPSWQHKDDWGVPVIYPARLRRRALDGGGE